LHVLGGSLEEGSPLDALVFFTLICGGFYVLKKRQTNWGTVMRNNRWLAIYLVYCFAAIFWSDFPFVAFKRWIKFLGNPIMVLILLTEPDPQEAIARLMKRCAYVLVPFSILLIKYYPELGRAFEPWSGEAVNCGVTLNKNGLGYLCLVLGYFFFWDLLKAWRGERGRARRNELLLCAGFLYLVGWLLRRAPSATSMMALMVAVLTVTVLGFRWVKPRYIGVSILAVVLGLVLAELAFGLSSPVLDVLGRDPTLTGRTRLWDEVMKLGTNPVLGAGFESFWLGDRLRYLWELHWWQPNEAHNGYLETYLNLGAVGLLLLFGLMIGTFRKIRGELMANSLFGRFRLGFLLAALVYNLTEAAFKGLHLVWFVFLIIAIDYAKVSESEARVPELANFEGDSELACS
jgi:O-antigen ligase